uniref:Ascorbate peroxidase n=1 Tax=Chattonella marina var. antiqua TaxID=859642 RepID=A0A2Z5VKJ9_CHAMQ|nr:ascorbate peroxidase [Chattonella marina var. antiqua]
MGAALCKKDTSSNTADQKLIEAVKKDLISMYQETPCMPLMVRLAWHDAGTYCAADKTGGANASIRFDPEKGHGANAGLQIAMEKLEPLKASHSEISYADLYQLASVVAIEFCGGPQIPFRLGRTDMPQEKCTPDGRLPDANQGCPHLRDIFGRMGMTDKEIVALSGAHTLGRAHKDRSGFEGAWTQEPLVFDNSYFTELLAKDQDSSLLKLPTDTAMLEDPEMKKLVESYAEDQKKFFEDYSQAHLKLSELGAFE